MLGGLLQPFKVSVDQGNVYVNDPFCAPDSMNEADDHLSGQVEQVTGGMCAPSQTSL